MTTSPVTPTSIDTHIDVDDAIRAARAVLDLLSAAWNAGDAQTYAALFTEDATFVNILGHYAVGPDEIAAGHDFIFRTVYAGSRIAVEPGDARMLADGLLQVMVRAALDIPAGPEAGHKDALATMLLARSGDGWKVTAFHNTRITS